MTAQRYTGSAFTNLSHIKRYTGSAFTDVSFGKRWTGSAWEQFWPLGGSGAISATFDLTLAAQTSLDSNGDATFNLTQAPQT